MAVTQYATRVDMAALGAAFKAYASEDPRELNDQLTAASRVVDSYLRGRYKLPFERVGKDVTDATSVIAAWKMFTTRGGDPSDPANEPIRLAYEDTIEWLKLAAAGRVFPDVTNAGGDLTTTSRRHPRVSSASGRGYNLIGTGKRLPFSRRDGE